jgi:4-hydroxybenzoate polyprenyltransferase
LDFQDYATERTEAKTFSQMLENGELILFVLFYGVFSFLTTMVREIIKDIEDIDGDYLMKMKTLPIILGRKRAQNIAIGHSFVLILVLIFVLKTLFQDPDYLNLGMYLLMSTLLPMLYFTYLLWTAKKKRHFENLSDLMKIIMLMGILSMILFTFG